MNVSASCKVVTRRVDMAHQCSEIVLRASRMQLGALSSRPTHDLLRMCANVADFVGTLWRRMTANTSKRWYAASSLHVQTCYHNRVVGLQHGIVQAIADGDAEEEGQGHHSV